MFLSTRHTGPTDKSDSERLAELLSQSNDIKGFVVIGLIKRPDGMNEIRAVCLGLTIQEYEEIVWAASQEVQNNKTQKN